MAKEKDGQKEGMAEAGPPRKWTENGLWAVSHGKRTKTGTVTQPLIVRHQGASGGAAHLLAMCVLEVLVAVRQVVEVLEVMRGVLEVVESTRHVL